MRRAIVFLGVLLCSVLIGHEVSAVDAPSWVHGTASVSQNIPVVAQTQNECAGVSQLRYVVEHSMVRKVCLFGNDRMKIGYFSDGVSYLGAVQFPMSDTMHVVEGMCSGATCYYSAEKDMLVALRAVQQGYQGLVVYLNVSQRIEKNSQGRYIFDTSNPEYSIKNDEGHYLITPTYAVSRSGEWIVVELRNAGTAVINTNTFKARQLVMDGYQYGYGMDPSEQLAVSDDGNVVVITGINAGPRVIEKVGLCGQELIGNLSKTPGAIVCPSSDLQIGTRFPNFHNTERPRFFGSSYQLEMTVNSWVDGSRRVTFLANGAKAVPKLKLLALGDSFSSGEGETKNAGKYLKGTDEAFDRCHISDRSYPFIIASALSLLIDEMKSVACAGATTKDIFGSNSGYWGQGGRLGVEGLKLTVPQRDVAKEIAVQEFQPGRALQSSFIERYMPQKIIIGIGGNDAGLMGKLRACVMPDTCEWVSKSGLRSSADEIKRLFVTFGSLFAHISQMSPASKVYVVGYPNIIDVDGACDPITGTLLNRTERVYIERSIGYLNQIIRAAAKQAEFTYLDIEQSMNGARLCNGGNSLAMNGLRLGDDISLGEPFSMFKIIGSETFHPTPVGHQLMASAVLARRPNLESDPVCATDPMACILTLIDINSPEYWGVGGGAASLSYSDEFALRSAQDPNKFEIKIPAGTFAYNSVATIEIRSSPVHLATVSMNDKGGFEGSVAIPESVMDGFHTMHVLGKNREDEAIDLYQAVMVGEHDNEGALFGENKSDTQMEGLSTQPEVGQLNGGVVNTQSVLGEKTAAVHARGAVKSSGDKLLSRLEKKGSLLIGAICIVIIVGFAAFFIAGRWVKRAS